MSSVGRKLLSSLVISGSTKIFADMHLGEYLFKGEEKVLYGAIRKHVELYGKIPRSSTLEGIEGLEDYLEQVVEPPEYYLHEVEQRYLHTEIKRMTLAAIELLKKEEPEEAYKIVNKYMLGMACSRDRHHLVDLREMSNTIAQAYIAEKSNVGDYLVKFGWDFLDNMTGGIRPGDFVSFVGRPAAGKTFNLLYSAYMNWMLTKTIPVFLSMEMNSTIIQQRLAAIHTSKPLTNLLKAMLSTSVYTTMIKELDKLKDKETPFWLIDGNLATTVPDIVMMCRQLKPSVVYVDGAYLLRHQDTRITKWARIDDNAEQMKQLIATDMGIPVVASYQLNREATKKTSKRKQQAGEGDKPGLEDIYGSDAIGQLSSVVVGAFEPETVETMKSRTLTVLKGRNGESGEFKINWDFNQMDFSQIKKIELEELQWIG